MASPTESNDPLHAARPATCTALVRRLPLAEAAEPIALHAATRAHGRVLLATAANPTSPLPHARKSLVVTRALVRLTVRDDHANLTALEPAAQPLLGDRPSLRVTIPPTIARTGRSDVEVLTEPSLFDLPRRLLALLSDRDPRTPLPIGVFGAFAYELVDRFEAIGPRRDDPLDDPDLDLVLATDFVEYDHAVGHVTVVTRGLPWERQSELHARHARTLEVLHGASLPPMVDVGRNSAPCDRPSVAADPAFVAAVVRLQAHIGAGDIFQAVLSRGVTRPVRSDSIEIFRHLAAREAAPYMFHLELEHGALLGASPETFLRVRDGIVEIKPIAGTTARDTDPDTDDRLALAMLFDPKERAEHVMLLDLARNDIARVSVAGTTLVAEQFVVEKYRSVQHLVSRVQGRLREGLDALHAYRAAANMGTLTGAPKPRAMELVRALESTARGFYGGAVGYLLADGSFDSAIAIRSLRVKDGIAHARAGAGIVWHSDPRREWIETERKLATVLAAVESSEATHAEATSA